MADLKSKLPENVSGGFYVDSQCIDCDVCRDTSPANFHRNDENGYSYVCKQPETAEELKLCKEAFDACPVEAIGDDAAPATAPLEVSASANSGVFPVFNPKSHIQNPRS